MILRKHHTGYYSSIHANQKLAYTCAKTRKSVVWNLV